MPEQRDSHFPADTVEPRAALPPLDSNGLLEQCMGNAALVMTLIDKFARQAREDVVRIEKAFSANDGATASGFAHGLKGAAGALCAAELQRAAGRFELTVRDEEFGKAARCLSDLKSEVDRCLAYLPAARAAAEDAARTLGSSAQGHP